MTDERDDEARQNFEFFSNEYAQALHAFKAIDDQSTTLMLLGVTDDLRGFVEQFIEMAAWQAKASGVPSVKFQEMCAAARDAVEPLDTDFRFGMPRKTRE